MIIYKVTNILNNKRYIGITVHKLKRRKWQHLSVKYSGTTLLSAAIKKYGKDNFIFEEIEKVDSEIDLIEREKYWIKELNTLRPNGYNVLPGQVVGKTLAKSRQVPVRCLELNKIFESISAAALELGLRADSVWSSCTGRTDFAGSFSFRYIDKEKYIKAQFNRANRISKAKEGYTKGAINRGKKIKCIETGQIFNSIVEAGKSLNIDNSQIVRVCKNKEKHAKGLHFVYVG